MGFEAFSRLVKRLTLVVITGGLSSRREIEMPLEFFELQIFNFPRPDASVPGDASKPPANPQKQVSYSQTHRNRCQTHRKKANRHPNRHGPKRRYDKVNKPKGMRRTVHISGQCKR
jgi:hypothetical protein